MDIRARYEVSIVPGQDLSESQSCSLEVLKRGIHKRKKLKGVIR